MIQTDVPIFYAQFRQLFLATGLRCLSTALHHPKQPNQATITVDDQRIPMPSVALGLVA
jgi:hypothetical protein